MGTGGTIRITLESDLKERLRKQDEGRDII